MRRHHAARALGLALLSAVALPALLAAKGPSIKPQFKKEFLDNYKRLETDVQFQAAKKSLKGNVLNPRVVDSYLQALPIPPLEMFRLERQVHKIDLAVPDFIESYNERWKELHPAAARRFYGDEGTRRNPRVATIDQLRVLEEITVKKSEAGPNRNVAFDAPRPPVGFQSEVQLVLNPNNPNQIVAASNTAAREPVTCGPRTVQSIYYSNDAGATWGRTCAPAAIDYGLDCAALGGITSGSDPALVWSTNNEVFLNHMMVCFNGSFHFAMVIARSQDAGVTWSARGVLKSSWGTTTVEDKEFLAIDNNAGSPWFGRLYSCWNRNNNQVLAFSSDGGATWTERDLPAPPQGGIDINCDMAVQKNGTVHLALSTIRCGGGDCHNEYLYHLRSTDGGNSWSAPSLVAETNLVSFSSGSCPAAQDFRCLGILGAIDVDNTNGPCEGTVYIAYSDFPTGANAENMDILVKRSTDGGATWSAAVKVNDDATSNIQFNPFMSVDPIKGQPVLAWVDGRNDPGNLSMDVYAARSVNCGRNFKKNVKVTQPSSEFNNSTISYSNESSAANPLRNGNQYGDYMGIDSRNGKAYVAWTDSRNFFPSFQTDPQRENIGFAAVTFGPPAPENLTLTLGNGQPALSWDYTPPADLAAINVYLVSNGGYTKILTIPATQLKASASHPLSLEKPANGQTPSVVVAAVDTEGEEGPYSSPVTVVLADH